MEPGFGSLRPQLRGESTAGGTAPHSAAPNLESRGTGIRKFRPAAALSQSSVKPYSQVTSECDQKAAAHVCNNSGTDRKMKARACPSEGARETPRSEAGNGSPSAPLRRRMSCRPRGSRGCPDPRGAFVWAAVTGGSPLLSSGPGARLVSLCLAETHTHEQPPFIGQLGTLPPGAQLSSPRRVRSCGRARQSRVPRPTQAFQSTWRLRPSRMPVRLPF